VAKGAEVKETPILRTFMDLDKKGAKVILKGQNSLKNSFAPFAPILPLLIFLRTRA